VALCTRNGARFVREQVESIVRQSVLPFEVVLSDDDSSDDTIGIAEAVFSDFLRTRPGVQIRLVVVRNVPPLGVTGNFERAISATTGELVVLCDQDDVWAPDRLAVAVERFVTQPDLLLLHGDARLVDGAGSPLGLTLFEALGVTEQERDDVHGGNAFRALMRRNLVTGATTMFRRSLLNAAMPFPSQWVHDEWLAAIAASMGRIDFLEQPLVDYRQHGANQIGVAKLSFLGKLRKLREPRAARNRRLLENSVILCDRLHALERDSSISIAPEVLAAAEGKRGHEVQRSALPAARLGRIGAVLRERRAGGYKLYGRGNADVLRDLLQPAR
jgi:glycosyltransferase involved in cell wall biosynthesis